MTNEVVGGAGAVLAALTCCKEFVVLEFQSSALNVLSLSRSCRFHASLTISSGIPSCGCVRMKDLMDALGCCDAMAAARMTIGFDQSSARLVVGASEEGAMAFQCEIKSVDMEIVQTIWTGPGDEIGCVSIDTEVLYTALSQIHDRSNESFILKLSPSGEMDIESSSFCRVHIPRHLVTFLSGTMSSGFACVVSMKDVGSIVAFLVVAGDSKTRINIFQVGIRFLRNFFSTSEASIEILTASPSD